MDSASIAGGDPAPADAGSPALEDPAIRNSAGFRANALIDMIGRIHFILQGNVADYRSFVSSLQDPAVSLPLLSVDNAVGHDRMLSEAERLLHNVLTAMSTRVDQQRRFMNKYFADDSTLTVSYSDRVKAVFAADLLAEFLKRLRNQLTHYKFPVAQSRLTMGAESYSVRMVLPTSALLANGEWSSDVREWIASHGTELDIFDAADEYAIRADQFDLWLASQIRAKYAKDILTYEQARDEAVRRRRIAFGV
ncbi:hypothetical protein SAMN05892883_2569 [Jatrophihabitans sp. GAS493]|nr:hypothetical protein SAMN05892883_2569 [Jatrophihabitans sp. GAS493]